MNWNEFGKKIAKYAPLIGDALPVPGGAAIGSIIASTFGGNPGDLDDLTRRIEADSEAALKLRQLEVQHSLKLQELAMQRAAHAMAADTQRIESINMTMRAEAKSDKWWTSGWRPFWGFISGIAFFVQVTAIAYLMVSQPKDAGVAIGAIGNLSVFWAVPLAILGVSAWHRGVEKRLRAGESKSPRHLKLPGIEVSRG